MTKYEQDLYNGALKEMEQLQIENEKLKKEIELYKKMLKNQKN